MKLESVIRFFDGNAPENINGIFGSKEAIEGYKKSLGDEMITSLRLYTEANDKDMRKHGIPTIKEQLNKILEMLTTHVEKDKQASEQARQIRNRSRSVLKQQIFHCLFCEKSRC